MFEFTDLHTLQINLIFGMRGREMAIKISKVLSWVFEAVFGLSFCRVTCVQHQCGFQRRSDLRLDAVGSTRGEWRRVRQADIFLNQHGVAALAIENDSPGALNTSV